MSLAWHDGKFVDKKSITVNPADFGFARGLTIFEATRVYGGVPFRLEDHIDRFEQGAREFAIANPFGREDIIRAVEKITAENRFAHSLVKFYLTAGECAQYSAISFAACDGFTPHLMIMEDEFRPAHPEAPYGVELYRRGISLKSIPRNREFPAVKSMNYASGYIAARTHVGKEWDDVLFTRPDGCIAETPRSNIFCVIGGVLRTPKDGILYGVTRKVVMELAARLGIKAEERDFTVADLAQASEVFICSTTVELLPVKKVDSCVLPVTVDGPVFAKLRKAFTDYIAE